tara:strand:- start:3370 stop:3975 length:606 start_codon:yes stop_codon:yes gene_type:complete
MTSTEALEYLDLLLDKADQPYFIDDEKEKFINLAITEFINKYYDKFELTGESKTALNALYRFAAQSAADIATWNFPNRYDIVDNSFMYPIAVKVDSNEAEFKGYKEYIEDLSTSDPFNKSNQDYPSYVVSNKGINMNPAPTVYFRLVYLYRPTITEAFDDGKLLENYQIEILNIASRKMFANIESQSYEVQSIETERGINQ